MGGTISMWADGQLPAAGEVDETLQGGSTQTVIPPKFVGRSPGQLAWMRLRRDRTAMVSGWVLAFLVLVALLAKPIQWLYGYDGGTGNSDLLDDTGTPLGYLGGITFGSDNPSHHAHFFGVEPRLGRDLFMLVIWGMQTALTISVISTVISVTFGVVVGIVSAYFGGWVDAVLSWIVDYLLAFPFLLFCLAVIPVVNTRLADAYGEVSAQKRVLTIIFVFAGFGWMYTARLVRGQVLSLREREYVDAARAAGAGVRHILFRQLLPNLWAPILVTFSLGVPQTITAEAALSFLGVGVVEPTPDLGRLILNSSEYLLSDPTYLLIPGIAIFVLVLTFNLFGDSLRDALDPRSSR
jgi:peptide/nickel transport system permease protein